MPEAKRSANESASARDAMIERLRAERERGWPGGVQGWTEDMTGYVPLEDIPVRDPDGFGLDGCEPIPPDQQQLPDPMLSAPTLFDDMDDKASRRQARRINFNRTGALD